MKTHVSPHARPGVAPASTERNKQQTARFGWSGLYRKALWLALTASIIWTGFSLVHSGDQAANARSIAAIGSNASYHYATKPIEQIKEGDHVLARNPVTGEIEKKRVEATFIRTCDHIRVLDFQAPNGDIQRHETTDEHPYYLPKLDKFVNAADLQPGAQVTGPNGERQYLIASTRRDEPNGITVYNFSVEDHHVYFVAGRDSARVPVLVHNADDRKYMGTEYGKQLVAAGKPSRRHYAPVPRKSDFPVPKPKMRVKKKDKLLKELTAIGNSAVGETGKKANTRLRSMAKKAGLVVKEGGEHQRIERPDGSLVTPLPHSPKGDGTIKSIVKSILDEVDG